MKIGDKYERLTIDSEIFRHKNAPFVNCRCECGTKKPIRVYHLKSGKTRSCGCLRREVQGRGATEKYPIKVGEKYGRLTVLSKHWKYFTDSKGRPARVEVCTCLCECETIKEGIIKHNLLRGKTLSCGCLISEHGRSRRQKDNEGDKVGIFTLVLFEKRGKTRRLDTWKAKCSCGTEKSITVTSMLVATECTCQRSKHIGVTYNDLTILSVFNKDRNQFAVCICSCSAYKTIRASSVVSGVTKTCGHKILR
jgi:hypothetical protein